MNIKRIPANIMRAIKDPFWSITSMSKYGFLNWMSDERYITLIFKLRVHKKPNLKNPVTYNEKLQWLKLNNRNPLYTTLVDKYEVRKYVEEKIGREYLIKLIGVYDNFSDIDIDDLPDKFVIKCNHDSGSVFICKDKKNFNFDIVGKKITSALKRNYYYESREWPYKNVKPRIIIEEYMEDDQTKELRDYKFFCFNGKVKALFIASDRQNPNEDTKFDFFDEHYNHLDFTNGHPNAEIVPCKPSNFDKMKELAEKLSKDMPHVRIDFYQVNGAIYFGEFTFTHWGGMMPFNPEKWDYIFGEWLELPKRNI